MEVGGKERRMNSEPEGGCWWKSGWGAGETSSLLRPSCVGKAVRPPSDVPGRAPGGGWDLEACSGGGGGGAQCCTQPSTALCREKKGGSNRMCRRAFPAPVRSRPTLSLGPSVTAEPKAGTRQASSTPPLKRRALQGFPSQCKGSNRSRMAARGGDPEQRLLTQLCPN